MAEYKLTFGDRVITYMGHEGYLSFGKPPIQRYEISLFKSTDGNGVSAGTVSMPFSAFDEIGIRCSWPDSRNTHGCNWLWFSNQAFTATTGNQILLYNIANGTNYYFFESNMNWDNTAKTFTVLNDQSTKYWGMYTPIGTTATINATNNNARHRIVGEIVGVKYQ